MLGSRLAALWLLCIAHALCADTSSLELPRTSHPTELRLELDGQSHLFQLTRSDLIPSSLQKVFPNVQTWRATSGSYQFRGETSDGIFRGQITSPGNTFYLDPVEIRSTTVRYRLGQSLPVSAPVTCAMEAIQVSSDAPKSLSSTSLVRRTFRIAIAASGEYTQFHGGKQEAFAAIVTAINRASGIFERELGIRFVLADNLDRVIYTDPASDPFSENTSSMRTIEQAQVVFDREIGTSNYDFGLVFNTGLYGLAYIRSVGDPATKGSGCVGLPQPTGDPFHVAILTHEIAHQFGANHTFNTVAGLCSGRRHEWAAFEPGTGSTIMSYASLPCANESFQPHHDDYFHSESLREIKTFIQSISAGTAEPLNNHAPTVNAGGEYWIPSNTPFVLTATASDPDGDDLTYCWEQRDRGPASNLSDPDSGAGPLFRSFYPTNSPARYFPNLTTLLSGQNSAAEKLPNIGRAMRFRVTVRDGRGGSAFADTQLQVTNTGTAFRIISHNAPAKLNSSATITWDPAGTANFRFNAGHVRISMSTDGGKTFPHILSNATANDGSETVQLPALSSAAVRFKIQPLNNVFFAINEADLQVGSPVLLVSSEIKEGMFNLSWAATSGYQYRVESTASPPIWTEESCQITVSNGVARAVLPLSVTTQRFFRVHAQPNP